MNALKFISSPQKESFKRESRSLYGNSQWRSGCNKHTSESINKCLKTYASAGKKNIHTVFRTIYNYKMDHNQRIDSGERYAKRRPEELIEKYKKIKQTLNHYDNLPNALKHLSLLSTLQCLGEI